MSADVAGRGRGACAELPVLAARRASAPAQRWRLRPGTSSILVETKSNQNEGDEPADRIRNFLGESVDFAMGGAPLPAPLGWLTAVQSKRARRLAQHLIASGTIGLTCDDIRFCVGLGLLHINGTGDMRAAVRNPPLAAGGAQLILSAARRALWPTLPPALRVVDAVMGVDLPPETRDAMQAAARRHSGANPDALSPSELGILLSNERAWKHALAAGWEWTLILEDDSRAQLDGGVDQLLAMLPDLIDAAAAVDPDWSLLVLSPWGLENFYAMVEPSRIPLLVGAERFGTGGREVPPLPAWTRRPTVLGRSGWRRVGPTFHAFGWVYRAPLMELLVEGLRARSPPLNPLDVWVWEVMALHGLLGRALSPAVVEARERDKGTSLTPAKFDGEFRAALVGTRSMPGSHDSLNRGAS